MNWMFDSVFRFRWQLDSDLKVEVVTSGFLFLSAGVASSISLFFHLGCCCHSKAVSSHSISHFALQIEPADFEHFRSPSCSLAAFAQGLRSLAKASCIASSSCQLSELSRHSRFLVSRSLRCNSRTREQNRHHPKSQNSVFWAVVIWGSQFRRLTYWFHFVSLKVSRLMS